MSAQPTSSEAHSDRPHGDDDFARRLPGLGEGVLRLLLRALQERLGTPAEQPGDVERARLLGHEINNRVTVVKLNRDLAQLDATSSSITPRS